MIVVETRVVRLLGIAAITIYPFVFVDPACHTDRLMLHEGAHWDQQRTWFRRGLGIGLVVYWMLYLLVLPVLWNPVRKRSEVEAFRSEGIGMDEINRRLRGWPYLLRW